MQNHGGLYRSDDAVSRGTTEGLAQQDAYETVLRDAMSCGAGEPAGVYFGTRSGKVFASRDEGGSFAVIADAFVRGDVCEERGARLITFHLTGPLRTWEWAELHVMPAVSCGS